MADRSFKPKLWITPDLQKSISVKNKFLWLHQKKDPTIKAELHLKYKNHRNLISTLWEEVNKLQ